MYPTQDGFVKPQLNNPNNSMPVQIVVQQQPIFRMDPIDYFCSYCKETRRTLIEHESGSKAWIWCFILLGSTGCCCFIPFLMDNCKDVKHKCSICQRDVGTYERSAC